MSVAAFLLTFFAEEKSQSQRSGKLKMIENKFLEFQPILSHTNAHL